MSVLSVLANINTDNIDMFSVLIAVVSVVMMSIFVKKTKENHPELNKAMNTHAFMVVVIVFMGVVWLATEILREYPSPPLQLLSFVLFMVALSSFIHIGGRKMVETSDPSMGILIPILANFVVLVLFFFNQSSDILASMDGGGWFFRGVRIPNSDPVMLPMLLYLLTTFFISVGNAIVLFTNSTDAEFLRDVCAPANGGGGGQQMGSITHQCVETVNHENTTYFMFMHILFLLGYTVYHFKNA